MAPGYLSPHRGNKKIVPEVKSSMSPLQLSVFWRLSLAFFFNSFLFFLDIFLAVVVDAKCHAGNATRESGAKPGSMLPRNQSEVEDLFGDESDWVTKSGDRDVSK